MDHILYVLPLKDKTAFKVGITGNDDLRRVKQLSKLYDFNLNESLIVKSNSRIIKALEKQLLADYNHYQHNFNEKSDGHTEFLKYKCIKNVICDINHKKKIPKINITIDKGIVFEDVLVINQNINNVYRNVDDLIDVKEVIKAKKWFNGGDFPREKPNKQDKIYAGFNSYDFSSLDTFIKIVEDNKDIISVEIDKRQQGDITGERLILHVNDDKIIKSLSNHCSVNNNNSGGTLFYKFFDYAEYNKENTRGFIKLGGIYDKFEHEQRFDNIFVYTEYVKMLNKIKELCTIITK